MLKGMPMLGFRTDVGAHYHFNKAPFIAFEAAEKTYVLPVVVDPEIAKRTIAIPFQHFACIKTLENVKIKPVSQKVENA